MWGDPHSQKTIAGLRSKKSESDSSNQSHVCGSISFFHLCFFFFLSHSISQKYLSRILTVRLPPRYVYVQLIIQRCWEFRDYLRPISNFFLVNSLLSNWIISNISIKILNAKYLIIHFNITSFYFWKLQYGFLNLDFFNCGQDYFFFFKSYFPK